MSDSGVRHHLAAILAADVAGFTRLMAEDERATLAALDAAREVFRKRIESRDGHVIDMAGDSVLAVFDSAKSAVKTALEIQKDLRPRASTPAERRLQFRIGVHLGDVIEKADGTVYGDGVNIAARLQTKAPPGGICLSQTVHDTVSRKLALQAHFGGRESFKNIPVPIPVWIIGGTRSFVPTRWLAGALAGVLALALAVGGWYWTRSAPKHAASIDGKSLAVLPLINLSEDKDLAYFADGLHEDLLTQLALLGDLKVVSRTSVMDYRGSKKGARQIGAELGVASLVEGSVRRAGNQVRLTAQLVDTRSDQQVWAKSYDRELKDVFLIQSELATEIARALQVSLAPQEQTRLARKPTDNLEAYDLLLRHQDLVNRSAGTVRAVTTVKQRIALLDKAVELDPKFALAWARLGAEHARAYGYGVDPSPQRQSDATQAMDRALALAPDDPQIKIEKGVYYLYALYDNAHAQAAYEEVLKAAPNNVDALLGLAEVHNRQQRLGESLTLLERVLAVDTRNMLALVRLATEYRNLRHFDRAIALRKQMIQMRPDDLDLQANYAQLEYWHSGSWAQYDAWRVTAPQNAHQKSFRVWSVDFDRAVARHDFDQALRMLEIVPEDVRGAWDSSDEARTLVVRALLLHAKGELSASRNTARAALARIDTELAKTPDSELATGKALMLALLGQRERALSAREEAIAMAAGSGLLAAEHARRASLDIAGLLDERDAALAEISRQVQLPNFRVHALRVNLALASLWGDWKFDALVNDPANNAPLPFSARYTPGK